MPIISIKKYYGAAPSDPPNVKTFPIPYAEAEIVHDMALNVQQMRRELEIAYAGGGRDNGDLQEKARKLEMQYAQYIVQIYRTYVDDEEFNRLNNPNMPSVNFVTGRMVLRMDEL